MSVEFNLLKTIRFLYAYVYVWACTFQHNIFHIPYFGYFLLIWRSFHAVNRRVYFSIKINFIFDSVTLLYYLVLGNFSPYAWRWSHFLCYAIYVYVYACACAYSAHCAHVNEVTSKCVSQFFSHFILFYFFL